MRWLLPFTLASLMTLSAGSINDWPQWRGPQRDGSLPEAHWPDRLQGNLRPLWSVDLGPSYSGPIVVGERVFTTETRDKRQEIVRALDRATGQELWKAEWDGAISVPFFAKSNGDWIRATPAADAERLYVAGMRDVLLCLDLETGQPLWRVDFVEQFKSPLPAFGFVSSPLVDGEGVFVQAGASVVRLNKLTGKVTWRALVDGGGMWGSAFSSPVLATVAGRRQLVVLTREKLAGVDPESGELLWEQKVEAFRGMNILTPIVFGDAVFTAAYGGKTHLFSLTPEEGGYRVEERWKHKAQGYMSTPVVVGDHAWLLTRAQRLTCFNLHSGEELWTTRKSFGKYWSLVAGDGKILALDQQGVLYLLRANPGQFDLLDSAKISDQETWAHLALSGRWLFVRSLRSLSAFEWGGDGT